jgi:hypothetical protein
MDSNMPLPFDGLVNAALGLVIVAVVSAIAIWLARINYWPHRVPELSELSGEQIKRRKTIYELTLWTSGIALAIAGLLLVKSCE